MTTDPPLTYQRVRLPISETRTVSLPNYYPHEFASLPDSWFEVRIGTASARYVELAMPDPAGVSPKESRGSRTESPNTAD